MRERGKKRSSSLWLYFYDLRWGIAGQWKKWLMVVLFCLGACLYLNMQIKGMNSRGNVHVTGTVLDFLIHFIHGMEPFDPSAQNAFQIPVVYMGSMILISYLVGGYASKDLEKTGIQTMTRTHSRTGWMAAKIMWNITAVAGVFLILTGCSVLFGEKQLSVTELLCEKVMHMHEAAKSIQGASMTELQAVGLGLLMAMLTSLAFAQLQMAVELLTTPVIGFLWNLGLVFLSAYITSPFLLGNYWMLQRNWIFLETGMYVTNGLLATIGILIVSVIADLLIIRKKDIL